MHILQRKLLLINSEQAVKQWSDGLGKDESHFHEGFLEQSRSGPSIEQIEVSTAPKIEQL
jgi:hypothetical protein